MSNSTIEQELLEVTALKKKETGDRQKYLTKLMLAVTKLPDPEWEGLSKAAQDWTNGNAEAHKGGSPVEDFPDYEEEEEIIEETEEDEEPVEVKPAKKSASSPKPRKSSACHMIKKIVVKNPTISIADLSEQLKQDGLKVSDVTIATLRSDLRDTLRVLNELGMGEFAL